MSPFQLEKTVSKFGKIEELVFIPLNGVGEITSFVIFQEIGIGNHLLHKFFSLEDQSGKTLTPKFERPLTKEELKTRNDIRKFNRKKKKEELKSVPSLQGISSSNLFGEKSLTTRASLDSKNGLMASEIRFNIQVLGCQNAAIGEGGRRSNTNTDTNTNFGG